MKNNWFEKLCDDVILSSPDHSGILFCYPAKAQTQKRYSEKMDEDPEKNRSFKGH